MGREKSSKSERRKTIERNGSSTKQATPLTDQELHMQSIASSTVQTQAPGGLVNTQADLVIAEKYMELGKVSACFRFPSGDAWSIIDASTPLIKCLFTRNNLSAELVLFSACFFAVYVLVEHLKLNIPS
jgi:hypothetical protein